MAEQLSIRNKRKAKGKGGHRKHTDMHSSYHSTWDNAKRHKGRGNNTASRRGSRELVIQPAWVMIFVPPTADKLRMHPSATGGYKWKKAEA